MTAVATPCDAPRPAAANAQAVTPSRGPQPPTLGSAPAASTSSANGSSSDGGAVTPAACAAITNVAVCPATTSVDDDDGGPRPHGQRDADRRRDQTDGKERHGRMHGRRQDEEHGDGEDDLHDLSGYAFPHDRAQPVAYPTVDVAHHATGERDVEEERAIVRGHRRAQREVDVEPAGHHPPAPGAAHRGEDGERGGGREGSAINRLQSVEEGARSRCQTSTPSVPTAAATPAHLMAAPAGRRGRR